MKTGKPLTARSTPSGPSTDMPKITCSGWSTGSIPSGLTKSGKSARSLVDAGMLDEVDDIFMFNRYEIPQLLTEVSTAWALGVDIPIRNAPTRPRPPNVKRSWKPPETGTRHLPWACRRRKLPSLLPSCCGVSPRTESRVAQGR